MLHSPVAPPANIADPIAVTDWVELSILFSQARHVGKTEVRATLRSIAELEDDELDVQTELIINEVDRRKNLAPDAYPFKVDMGGISADESMRPAPYFFMLLLATSPVLRKEKRHTEVEPHFDALILEALKNMLGPGSIGVRFAPTAKGRPRSFAKALEWLADKLDLKLGTGASFRPKRQDGGADVIVWRPFRDRRSGFLTILAQCTIQIDWRGKAKDIVEDQWRGWIDFGKTPMTCLAIPFVVPIQYEKWDELRRTVVIILDRMRVAELIASTPLASEAELKKWMKKELTLLNKIVKRKATTRLSRA